MDKLLFAYDSDGEFFHYLNVFTVLINGEKTKVFVSDADYLRFKEFCKDNSYKVLRIVHL